jgi:hypothetical protein
MVSTRILPAWKSRPEAVVYNGAAISENARSNMYIQRGYNRDASKRERDECVSARLYDYVSHEQYYTVMSINRGE